MPDSDNVVSSTIHPIFANIVGQNTTKSALSMGIAGVAVGNDLPQPLLLGPAGVGKTEIAEAFGYAISQELNCPFIRIGTPKDVRNLTEFEPIFDQLIEAESFVLYIDECHELEKGKVSHAKLFQFLRKGLDRQNEGKDVQIVDRVYRPDRKRKVIIQSTNHPGKMDSALVSRCSTFNLALYDTSEIHSIATKIFTKFSLAPENDLVLKRIAAAGRGTARPVVNLVQDHLLPLANLAGSNVVTVDQLMLAMKNSGLYPYGLDISEVELLLELQKRGNLTKPQILSAIPNLDGKLSMSGAYMQKWNLVETSVGGGLGITTTGRKFLKALDDTGFLA